MPTDNESSPLSFLFHFLIIESIESTERTECNRKNKMAARTDNMNIVKQNDLALVTELGISVRNDYGKTPTDKQKMYNSKLMTYR